MVLAWIQSPRYFPDAFRDVYIFIQSGCYISFATVDGVVAKVYYVIHKHQAINDFLRPTDQNLVMVEHIK